MMKKFNFIHPYYTRDETREGGESISKCAQQLGKLFVNASFLVGVCQRNGQSQLLISFKSVCELAQIRFRTQGLKVGLGIGAVIKLDPSLIGVGPHFIQNIGSILMQKLQFDA